MYAGVPITRPCCVICCCRRPLGMVSELRDPEVEQLDALAREQAAPRDDHDVLGLQIAVHHAALVRVIERVEHGTDDLQRPLDGQPRPVLAAVADQLGERLAREQLHGEIQVPVPLPELDHVDDVRVGELGRHPGFLLEPLHDLVVADELRMQQLHRDRLARRDLLGAIHAAHAPVPDHLEEVKARRESAAYERRFIHVARRIAPWNRQVSFGSVVGFNARRHADRDAPGRRM